MTWKVTTTWGPNAVPPGRRLFKGNEVFSESDMAKWQAQLGGRPMSELVGKAIRQIAEDGGPGTSTLLEVLP